MTRWSGIRLAIALLVAAMTLPAAAQDNLDRGKSGAQLYASNCAICHKTPQGLARAGGLFGVEGFLREHYTASRESAAVIAAYLRSVDAPAGPAGRQQQAPRRAVRGDGKSTPAAAKPAEKPAESSSEKPAEKKPEAPAHQDVIRLDDGPAAKPAEAKPAAAAESKPAEPKASEPKPSEAPPAEPKPATAAPKSE